MADVTLTWFDAPFAWSTRGVRREMTWEALLAALEEPELWPGEVLPSVAEQRLPGVCGATWRDDARVVLEDRDREDVQNRSRIEKVQALLVEYEDDPAVTQELLARWWKGRRFAAFTTAWHQRVWGERPAGPRWRVIVPFARPATLDEAVELAKWARHPRHENGMIATSGDRVWRVAAAPAMNPGSYHWCHGPGELVDVDRALLELRMWRDQDRRHAAELALGDGLATRAIAGWLTRREAKGRGEVFSWGDGNARPAAIRAGALLPGPRDDNGLGTTMLGAAGALWPGRIAALVGPPESGRTALALQIAEVNAHAGRPVLYIATRMSSDEGIARLIAQRAAADVPLGALLAGGGLPDEVGIAAGALRDELPLLSWWSPRAAERRPEELVRRVVAASDLGAGRAPLVVLDSLDSWDGDEAALAMALFDAARPGTFSPDWPGAAFLVLDRAPTSPVWLSRASLLAAPPGVIPIGDGPVMREAALVLGLVTDPAVEAAGRRASIVAVRDRHGGHHAVDVVFRPVRGRFTGPPAQ